MTCVPAPNKQILGRGREEEEVTVIKTCPEIELCDRGHIEHICLWNRNQNPLIREHRCSNFCVPFSCFWRTTLPPLLPRSSLRLAFSLSLHFSFQYTKNMYLLNINHQKPLKSISSVQGYEPQTIFSLVSHSLRLFHNNRISI